MHQKQLQHKGGKPMSNIKMQLNWFCKETQPHINHSSSNNTQINPIIGSGVHHDDNHEHV
jgi:hypothetical protein